MKLEQKKNYETKDKFKEIRKIQKKNREKKIVNWTNLKMT